MAGGSGSYEVPADEGHLRHHGLLQALQGQGPLLGSGAALRQCQKHGRLRKERRMADSACRPEPVSHHHGCAASQVTEGGIFLFRSRNWALSKIITKVSSLFFFQVVGETDGEENPAVRHAWDSSQSRRSDCSWRGEERLGLQQSLGKRLPSQCKDPARNPVESAVLSRKKQTKRKSARSHSVLKRWVVSVKTASFTSLIQHHLKKNQKLNSLRLRHIKIQSRSRPQCSKMGQRFYS